MGMRFDTGRGDSTAVADRVRVVELADDGTDNVAGAAVAPGVPLTFSLWLNPPSWNLGTSALQTYMCLYARAPTGGSTSKYVYEVQAIGLGTSANALSFRTRIVGGTSQASAAYTLPGTVGDKVHLAGVFVLRPATTNRVDQQLYLNGTPRASNTGSATVRPENTRAMDQTMIGAGGAVNTTASGTAGQENRANDTIYEAAIWNARLTDDEIAALAKGFRPSLIRPSRLRLYVPGIRGTWGSPYGPQPSCALGASAPPARLKTQADSAVTTVDHIRRIG